MARKSKQQKFNSSKILTIIYKVDVDVMFLSNKFSCSKNNGFKYFIDYKIDKKIMLLCILLP